MRDPARLRSPASLTPSRGVGGDEVSRRSGHSASPPGCAWRAAPTPCRGGGPPRRAAPRRASPGPPWCPWSAPGRPAGARGRAGGVVPRSQRPPTPPRTIAVAVHLRSVGKRGSRVGKGRHARPPRFSRGVTGEFVAPPRAAAWDAMGLGARPRSPSPPGGGVPAGARERSWRAVAGSAVLSAALAWCVRDPPCSRRRDAPPGLAPTGASPRQHPGSAGPDRERSLCPVPTRTADPAPPAPPRTLAGNAGGESMGFVGAMLPR